MKKNETQQSVNIGSMSGGIIANEVKGGIVQQNSTQQHLEKIDFEQIALELNQLRKAMREFDTEAEHVIPTAEIQKAEQAAQKKDGEALKAHLKEAGKWALDIATKIGISLVSEMLKSAIAGP